MAKLNVAIIGCGNIFPVHADAIKGNHNAELRAVVDINKNKAEKAGKKYDCNFYTEHKEMLKNENIDIVQICTPHHKHADIAVESMKFGVDVLVEKPLANNIEQAKIMIKAANKYNKRLGVVFQNRFKKNILKAKEVLESGRLGKIEGIKGILTWFRDENYYQQADWRGKFSTEGGGVLINQAIHTLDLLQWFGGEVEAVYGNVSTRRLETVIEVEDTADANLFFKSGASGIFFATNCYSNNSNVNIEIDCENGEIKLDNNKLIIKTGGVSKKYSYNESNKYKSYWGYGHKVLIEGFYKDILENSNKFTVSGKESIKTQKIIQSIYKSSKSNSKVFI